MGGCVALLDGLQHERPLTVAVGFQPVGSRDALTLTLVFLWNTALCVCVCVGVCVGVCVCVCVCVCVHVHVKKCVHVSCVCACTCMCTCIEMRAWVCIVGHAQYYNYRVHSQSSVIIMPTLSYLIKACSSFLQSKFDIPDTFRFGHNLL